MIEDDELINMIRDSATEELPIAVMTVKEMRQFAQKVAADCIEMAEFPDITIEQLIRWMKDRYGLNKN